MPSVKYLQGMRATKIQRQLKAGDTFNVGHQKMKKKNLKNQQEKTLKAGVSLRKYQCKKKRVLSTCVLSLHLAGRKASETAALNFKAFLLNLPSVPATFLHA